MSAISAWLDRNSLYIALLAAWVATLGSLYFSEVAGYVPCVLCWYQRILMYPLTLILAVGLMRQDAHLPLLVLPFSAPGLCVSLYHYLLEKTDLFSSEATCKAGVSCTVAWINWFGFITIPFLALVGFVMITVMTLIALQASEPSGEEVSLQPWIRVVVIIILVFGAFGLLLQFDDPAASAQGEFTVVQNEGYSAQSQPAATLDSTDPMRAMGQRLYLETCATCHGQQGEGVAGLGNALVDATFLHTESAENILSMIRAGRAATDPANQSGLVMPPSGGRPDLTDEELLAIVAYVRGH